MILRPDQIIEEHHDFLLTASNSFSWPCTSRSVCVHERAHPRACVSMSVHIQESVCVHERACPGACSCMCARACARVHACVHEYMYPCMCARKHTCVHVRVHVSMHVCTNTCIHACVHLNMHVCTCVCMYPYISLVDVVVLRSEAEVKRFRTF
uniref:Uncharacterized protein n=1 Tax=Oryzias melastigma TaxID=30732 RepID=A0A3B3BQS2_ORYME